MVNGLVKGRKGMKLHPVREARGWLFDPAEVAELKLTRTSFRGRQDQLAFHR